MDVSFYWPWVLLFVWAYITQRPLGGAWGEGCDGDGLEGVRAVAEGFLVRHGQY